MCNIGPNLDKFSVENVGQKTHVMYSRIKTKVTIVTVLKRGTNRGRYHHSWGNRVGNRMSLDIDSSSRQHQPSAQ